MVLSEWDAPGRRLHDLLTRSRVSRRALPLGALALAARAAPAGYDRFGGDRRIRSRATGLFRTERIGGRWMLISPEGHGYVALGSNHIGKYMADPAQSGPLLERFRGDRKMAEQALIRAIASLGLNAGEAYDPLLGGLRGRLPRIENVDLPGGVKFRYDIFDWEFQRALHQSVKQQCSAFAGDPWVIGAAAVNEPVWDWRRVNFYRQLPPLAAGRIRYHDWLEKKHPGIDSLNRAWGTSFRSFGELRTLDKLPLIEGRAPHEHGADDEFLGLAADELHARLKAAVNAGAPWHLFLGERFVLRFPPDAVLRAVGNHVDVFCTQSLIHPPQRPPEWQIFQPERYRYEHGVTGKPMIIVDWATPFSLDTTYSHERGVIKDERAATADAAAFVAAAFAEPFLVGLFQCQLIGRHGNDRLFPDGRMKRTYLRDDATPWPYRTAQMAKANRAALRRVYDSAAAAR
ncbi:MAG: hypothetical protein R2762_21460 [Bryobacteraceae bacterium]